MSMSFRSRMNVAAFWPLVLLALLARLSFGSMAQPLSVFDDSLRELSRLSVLCDDPAPLSHPDEKHHASDDDQSGSFLLAEALELLCLALGICFLAAFSVSCLDPVWAFPPVRGPPFCRWSSLCPQGPPA
ncbi:hypothetical protein K2X14_07320 [Acetobacter sp. TBRC 12305]|uniref:Transmembrane protein n=1 Tax=Acetobacter garciniae TaxID=2817435 RepID=A0A939KM58_9PROT|nr:hypothetical protein [Acetobacter garciniae]MBO1324953.1 hypothetical protein [Acetobacter garciniae]MBX0344644.1 hypothetical protein [Acetobacter garciniae]